MTSFALRLAAVIAAVSVVALAAGEAAIAEDIGTASAITTVVTGTLNTDALTLKSGDAVYQNEVITTDENGVGQFLFRDETKLAVGPGSTVVLDNFVYDSDTSKAKVVINLTQGAFRFITGKSDHTAYEIVTPTATIGVRGTAFDVYTKDNGELAVAMISGSVEVCPRFGLCRVHDVIGEFLHMTPFGNFSLRKAWDGTFLKGIPFKTALPFLSDQNNLLPALRGSTSTVGRYLKVAGNDIGKVLKLPLTKFPKLKLPNLFK